MTGPETGTVALARTVHGLHESVLASRRRVRQRLLTIQHIEGTHHGTPLGQLAALAVSGALQDLAPDREDVQL